MFRFSQFCQQILLDLVTKSFNNSVTLPVVCIRLLGHVEPLELERVGVVDDGREQRVDVCRRT